MLPRVIREYFIIVILNVIPSFQRRTANAPYFIIFSKEGHSILHLTTIGGHLDASLAVIKRSSALLRLPNKVRFLMCVCGYKSVIIIIIKRNHWILSFKQYLIGSSSHYILAHKHEFDQIWKTPAKLKTGAVFTNFLAAKAFKPTTL